MLELKEGLCVRFGSICWWVNRWRGSNPFHFWRMSGKLDLWNVCMFVFGAAATVVRAGEGGSVRRREEGVPPQGHRAVPVWERPLPLPALQQQRPGFHRWRHLQVRVQAWYIGPGLSGGSWAGGSAGWAPMTAVGFISIFSASACDVLLVLVARLHEGVIHGSWACWSTWSSCTGPKRSRSRSCSNPAPQNGGSYCSGASTETSDCEDDELQYLKLVYWKAQLCVTKDEVYSPCLCLTRTMEPQCFDKTLPESHKCGTPPPLVNGYIRVNCVFLTFNLGGFVCGKSLYHMKTIFWGFSMQDPKDVYIVGSKVEYTCTAGFYLTGYNTIECTQNKTWSAKPGLCTSE